MRKAEPELRVLSAWMATQRRSQISGRSELKGDDAIRLDLRYVENWSLTLDLMILWMTASAVLTRRGAT
jgi:lipopolysaccharide/colanic/teichoic acid biosynthesis glycosyltransferase